MSNEVDHPSHYNMVPGIECIEVTRHFNNNLGNAIKYIWRLGHKVEDTTDLEKAIWYLKDELARLKKKNCKQIELPIGW